MKKSTFFHLVTGTVGGLLFALGMCMCLIPEWNAFQTGVVCTALGAAVLLIQSIVAWLRSGRRIRISWKAAVRLLYGVFAALVFGTGMFLVLGQGRLLPGIGLGILGIVLLLLLIPMCLGLK